MNRLSTRLIFILATFTFCLLGIQNSIEYGGFQQFESQDGMIPEGWSGQELNELATIVKIGLLLVLCLFTLLGYRLIEKFKINSVVNALVDFVGISIAFALAASFLIRLVPFDFFTISNIRPIFSPSIERVFGSIFHLSLFSFFLGVTIWVLEKTSTLNSEFSKFYANSSRIWVSIFLLYAFIDVFIILTLSEELNTSWLANLALTNFIHVIVFSLICTICSWAFFHTFSTRKHLKSVKRWVLYVLFSQGFIGWVFILYALSNAFDFVKTWPFNSLSQWLVSLAIILIIAFVCTLIQKLNWFGFKDTLKLKLKTAELSNLKSQINPHFLFNSLNSIYGIALAEKSPKTADGVQKLSEMMRFMLKENTQEKISLNKEIEYIHNYIDLQSLRLDTNKHVQLNVSIEQPCDGYISPMLLIPMIENAFKHGVSIDKPSFIDISLACNESEVSLKVKNSNHHKAKTEAEESGIGLENVRKRLELLYPEKHLFQLYENEESFEAFIKIELA